MPSPDLLESAGQRAAYRPVPMPPPLEDLATEVDRRRKKRRAIGGTLAALSLVVAIPVGVSLVSNDQPDVVTFATEDGDRGSVSESPVAVQPAETSTSTTPSTSTSTTVVSDADAPSGPFAGMDDDNFDLSLNFGDTSISIEVITGGDAADRAAAAEAAADTTRTIDDETIWLDEQGDQVTASAFFDDETFVSVTGPADDIDRVLDLVTEHANGPITFFDPSDFADRFDLPDGLFDGDFELDLDGDGLPDDFDELFNDGQLPGFDDQAMEDFRKQVEKFSECMRIELDRSGDSASIEIPDCDIPGINGLVVPNAGDLFDGKGFDEFFSSELFDEKLFDTELFDREFPDGEIFEGLHNELDDLLEDVEKDIEDAFGDADSARKDAEDASKDAQDLLDDLD